MEETKKVSINTNGAPSVDKEGRPENQTFQRRKSMALTSMELTTAMGSTIDTELDQALAIEAQQSEENLRDTLNNKISELEVKLKQTNEYYEKLTQEVSTAKSQYEKERDECEDVISVARRNIEGQVAKILGLQSKKRELAAKIRKEEEKLAKEEEGTRTGLKSEEERLTRNIVILQTKLLINEGIKFERDQLLKKIKNLEIDLVDKEKYYQEELQRAKDQIQEKYNKLYQIANEHKESISEQVKNLSLRQQIAALKQAQEEIISTQASYKKASKNLLQIMDRNRTLSEKNHDIDINLTVQESLISAAKEMVEKFEKEEKESNAAKKDKEESEDFKEVSDDLTEIRRKIEEFKCQFFRSKDEEEELQGILDDQKTYLRDITDRKNRLHEIEQRLIPLADIAEYITKTGRVELKEDFKDPAVRYEMFQKLSIILNESEDLEKYISLPKQKLDVSVREKVDKPISPLLDETASNKERKRSPVGYTKENPFPRHLDRVEKKILSDLGLLGKYGTKQKKCPG